MSLPAEQSQSRGDPDNHAEVNTPRKGEAQGLQDSGVHLIHTEGRGADTWGDVTES